jgi:predicted small lipoprotein YifL
MKRHAGLLILTLVLAACGQKGALYLPDGQAEQVPPQPTGNPSTSGPVEQSDRDAARPRRVP